jgi:hypothetical protein
MRLCTKKKTGIPYIDILLVLLACHRHECLPIYITIFVTLGRHFGAQESV